MDTQKSVSHLETIFKNLSPTDQLTLVPINSRNDSSGDIRTSFHEQNMYLKNHAVFRVDNVFGINEPLFDKKENDETSITESLLQVDPSTKEPHFLKILQFNSNCINCIAKKNNEHQCLTTLNSYFKDYLPTLHPQAQVSVKHSEKEPVILGPNLIPNHSSPVVETNQSVFSTPPSTNVPILQ